MRGRPRTDQPVDEELNLVKAQSQLESDDSTSNVQCDGWNVLGGQKELSCVAELLPWSLCFTDQCLHLCVGQCLLRKQQQP